MKIVIGHRGAAGLELENSAAAITKAISLGTSRLEIDVRLTRDNRLVVCHDADLVKMANNTSRVAEHDWADLKKLSLRDGSSLLLLEDALKLIGSHEVIVEVKDNGSEDVLLSVLNKFPKANIWVASFKRQFLEELRKTRPDMRLYLLEHTKSLEAVQFANRHKLQGIGLNFWLLSPHSYYRARRAGLDVYLYTVNNRFLAWFLGKLYPQASICTDYPDRIK